MAVASLCACGGESGTRDRDRLNTQLWKGLLEKFPSDLESFCKFHVFQRTRFNECGVADGAFLVDAIGTISNQK